MSWESTLLVFCHLRWNSVFQRPQQLASRLAARRKVLFVEEPVHNDSCLGFWECFSAGANLRVCRPHTPTPRFNLCEEQIPLLEGMLYELLAEENVAEHVAWLYSPMATPLLDCLDPQAVVYDCMDELSLFRYAPRELGWREAELLARCDLVFTGGRSLYRHKRKRHPAVHCFPSSVDTAHFGKARRPGLPEPADQAGLPHPRLGYFGVIDERIDLGLLDTLAISRPDWQIVMVGPMAKVDPRRIPRHENLRFLGRRDYTELPDYLAGWDACLLPFARNDATRFISPTKTLEYMAAERPIVSTPIKDVAEPYRRIVYLADSHDGFVRACDRALNEDPIERTRRQEGMRQVIASTSWEATVGEMEALVGEAIATRNGSGRTPSQELPEPRRSDDAAHAEPPSPPVVVIGAGPTGLSAAYHLGADALLLEQNDRVGGWCRSIEVNGFTFDYAGHIMFSNEPYVHELYQRLLGDNVHWQDREAWIYSKNVFTRYPFQGSLYGLPAEVIKECILGAIEARFGSLGGGNGNGKAEHGLPGTNGTAANGHCKPGQVEDCCADGTIVTPTETERHSEPERAAPIAGRHGPALTIAAPPTENFEEFIYRVWGTGIAKHFAIPYNRKLWGVPLTEMETSWLGGRVPMPDLEEMLDGALSPKPKPMGPNARFGYPLRGGFQALMDGFLPLVEGPVRLNTRVVAVSPSRHTLTLGDGTTVAYDYLISTMPLPVLVRAMGEEAPPEVRRAAAGLRYVSVRCVHLGIGRENLTEKHWIYYPEDTVFHRIFVQGNASPHCNPPGGFGLTCEITYSAQKPLPCDGPALIDRCIADCRQVGMIRADDPIWAATQIDLPHAYVLYDHARAQNVATIRHWLSEQDILLAGRYSEWEYYNSDHAFIAGKKAAEQVRNRSRRVLRNSSRPLESVHAGG